MYRWARAQPELAAGVKSPNTIGQTSCAALSRSGSDASTESLHEPTRTGVVTIGAEGGAGTGLGAGRDATHAATSAPATDAATPRLTM